MDLELLMKIDLHCHTKKTKSGDSEKRTVSPEKFAEVLSNNNVRIASCTNHNYFSIEEYDLFKKIGADHAIMVWPGVELDVYVKSEAGHIIFICNPNETTLFDNAIKEMIKGYSPDSFIRPIEDVLNFFNKLDLIIIAHNSMKDHGFSDAACDYIKSLINDKNPILFEPSSLKSVGIMFAHGISGFIGSDVKDWDLYPINKIPELKMDVSSFDTFKLLIKKDSHAIKTFLDQKKTKQITITPFIDEGDGTAITLSIKDDINVIYGGKGTGKTKIIDALKKHYEAEYGPSLVKYYAGKTTASEFGILIKRVPDSTKYFSIFNLKNYQEEFKAIKEWSISPLTTTDSFYNAFKDKNVKGSFSKFGFSKATFSKISIPNSFLSAQEDYGHIKNGLKEIHKAKLDTFLSNDEISTFNHNSSLIANKALSFYERKYIDSKSFELTKWTITTMKAIALAKSGNHSIPASTGLLDLYVKQLELYVNCCLIINAIETKHIEIKDNIGYLPNKGMVLLKTEVYLNPCESTSINYASNKPSSNQLKRVLTQLKNLKNHAFDKDVGVYLKNYNIEASSIGGLSDFLGIKTEQCIQNVDGSICPYSASSGEQSMLLLSNALINDEAKVFLLDEPELSVGHKYVNDAIVPRLIELARMDKIIVISTHDSNIAVRTLPLVSIYRENKKTFQGNMFTDTLKSDSGEEMSWINTSLDCLEGGDIAFDERSKSYGKS